MSTRPSPSEYQLRLFHSFVQATLNAVGDMLSKQEAGDAIEREFEAMMTVDSAACSDFAPAGFAGHWREWHRGHGCNLDDGKL